VFHRKALRLYGVLHQRLKMLIDLEGAHDFQVSIFGGDEHLRGLKAVGPSLRLCPSDRSR